MTNDEINAGEQIRVSIRVNTPKPLSYVLIEDNRPASLEPKNQTSGYDYASGTRSYKMFRDASVTFFADQLPFGESVFTYETTASYTGTFRYGPAKLQCLYTPEITVYSSGGIIQVPSAGIKASE